MKKLTLLALIATSFAADLPTHNDEMKQLWSAWKDKHSKQYPEDEESNRLDIFAENHKKIHAHNAKNGTVTLGLNQFSDLTADEFKAQYTGGYLPLDQSPEEGRRLEGEENKRFLASLPASVDWRKKGAVTPVKNQHQCKGCWAFSSAAALESLHYIKTGNLINFSEQQLIDCDKTSHGCNAGHFSTAFAYTASKGIELESDYPFLDRTATCKYTSSKTYDVNTGYKSVSSHNANALMTAVVSQPVSVAIEADQHIFQFYKSGVITGSCGSKLDHAVLVVGYATVNGHQAFIVKNSYGTGWGESGYVYISTSNSANGGAGVCGILTAPGYPTA